jgi:hypothetical protein
LLRCVASNVEAVNSVVDKELRAVNGELGRYADGTLWSMDKAYDGASAQKVPAKGGAQLNRCGESTPLLPFACVEGAACNEGSEGDDVDGTSATRAHALLQTVVDVAGECELGSVDLTQFYDKMHMPSYLTMMAVDAINGQWDGHGGYKYPTAERLRGNNFYVYHDGSRFGIIPAGQDQGILNYFLVLVYSF